MKHDEKWTVSENWEQNKYHHVTSESPDQACNQGLNSLPCDVHGGVGGDDTSQDQSKALGGVRHLHKGEHNRNVSPPQAPIRRLGGNPICERSFYISMHIIFQLGPALKSKSILQTAQEVATTHPWFWWNSGWEWQYGMHESIQTHRAGTVAEPADLRGVGWFRSIHGGIRITVNTRISQQMNSPHWVWTVHIHCISST